VTRSLPASPARNIVGPVTVVSSPNWPRCDPARDWACSAAVCPPASNCVLAGWLISCERPQAIRAAAAPASKAQPRGPESASATAVAAFMMFCAEAAAKTAGANLAKMLIRLPTAAARENVLSRASACFLLRNPNCSPRFVTRIPVPPRTLMAPPRARTLLWIVSVTLLTRSTPWKMIRRLCIVPKPLTLVVSHL
jgi:hypothetical protein